MNTYLERLRRERDSLTVLTTGIAERAASEDRDITEAEETQVREAGERLVTIDRQVAEFSAQLAASNRYQSVIAEAEQALADAAETGDPAEVQRAEQTEQVRSIGELFVASGIVEEWSGHGMSRALSVGSIFDRALITLPDVPGSEVLANGGAPVTPPEPPAGSLAAIGRGSVETDTVYWVQDASVPVAGVVPEGTQKPELTIAPVEVSSPVVTIAGWVQVTRQALADRSYLQTYIDTQVRRAVTRKLNEQVVVGDGLAGTLLGYSAAPGLTPVVGVGPTAILDAIVAIEGMGYRPNAIIGNAATLAETVAETFTSGAGWQVNAMGDLARVQSMFGVPTIVDMYAPDGHIYVSDFRSSCMLWDRQQTDVRIGEQHADNFTKNITVVLGEGRWGFTVLEPAAIADVTAPVGP